MGKEVWVVEPEVVDTGREKKKPSRSSRIRRHIKFLVAHAAGVVIVRAVKKQIKKVPLIGPILSPIIGILPTDALGWALGTSIVVGIEENDPMAAPKMALRSINDAKDEVAGIYSDITGRLLTA